jgi:cysteine desulfurase
MIVMAMFELKQKIQQIKKIFSEIKQKKEPKHLETKKEELESLSASANFWSDNKRAQQIMQLLGEIKDEIEELKSVEEQIKNIEEIIKIVKTKNKEIIFHTDAVAACGIISIDVKKLNIDLLSLSGTQFYAPKGSGALFIKRGVRLLPQIEGGVQEEGRRAGTENVPSIIGLGKAAELARLEMEDRTKKLLLLRDRLIIELPKKVKYLYINGHLTQRLPNNVHCAIEFIEGEAMMMLLDNLGILVSSGSACASKALKASYVLTEIGLDAAVAQGSLLFSLGIQNTQEDIDYVLDQLPKIVLRLREMSPLWSYFQKTGKRQQAGPGTDYEHLHEHEDENSENI